MRGESLTKSMGKFLSQVDRKAWFKFYCVEKVVSVLVHKRPREHSPEIQRGWSARPFGLLCPCPPHPIPASPATIEVSRALAHQPFSEREQL